jgi:hypothetical protein
MEAFSLQLERGALRIMVVFKQTKMMIWMTRREKE